MKEYLQDSEDDTKCEAAEDFEVAFSLCHEEQNLPNEDQAQAFRDFLEEIRAK